MSNNCSVCNRLCKFSGAGDGKMLLVPVVAVGGAGLVGWPPHNEQEESRKRITRSGDRAGAVECRFIEHVPAPTCSRLSTWDRNGALRFLLFAITLSLYFLKAIPDAAFS